MTVISPAAYFVRFFLYLALLSCYNIKVITVDTMERNRLILFHAALTYSAAGAAPAVRSRRADAIGEGGPKHQ